MLDGAVQVEVRVHGLILHHERPILGVMVRIDDELCTSGPALNCRFARRFVAARGASTGLPLSDSDAVKVQWSLSKRCLLRCFGW